MRLYVELKLLIYLLGFEELEEGSVDIWLICEEECAGE